MKASCPSGAAWAGTAASISPSAPHESGAAAPAVCTLPKADQNNADSVGVDEILMT